MQQIIFLCSKRWYILESAVDFEILTREEICSHLAYLIHRSKGRLHYEDAISKWECDRTHIANYRSNELETIKSRIYIDKKEEYNELFGLNMISR